MDNTVRVDPPTTTAPTLSGEPALSRGWGTWAPEGGFHISFLSKNPSFDTAGRDVSCELVMVWSEGPKAGAGAAQ